MQAGRSTTEGARELEDELMLVMIHEFLEARLALLCSCTAGLPNTAYIIGCTTHLLLKL
jgi:hypothetical protein